MNRNLPSKSKIIFGHKKSPLYRFVYSTNINMLHAVYLICCSNLKVLPAKNFLNEFLIYHCQFVLDTLFIVLLGCGACLARSGFNTQCQVGFVEKKLL